MTSGTKASTNRQPFLSDAIGLQKAAGLDLASADALANIEAVRNGLLHQWDMGDEADGPVLDDQGIEDLQDEVESARTVLGVETSEAFVDEDRVETHLPARRLDDIRQAQSEGEGRDEGLSAGQGRCRAGPARVKVEDLEAQTPPTASGIEIAFEPIAPGRHGGEPQIGRVQDLIEHRADGKGLKIEIESVPAVKERGQPAQGT